jgi:hypothetical protein
MAVLAVAQMAEAQTSRRVVTARVVRPQRGTPPSSSSKGSPAQRVIVAQIPGGQIAEKPLPPGSAANAPVILRGADIEKRSITFRFKNKATNVSVIKVERKSQHDLSWKLVRTYKTNVNRSTIVPSKIDLGSTPDATYTLQDPGLIPGMPYRYRVTAIQSRKPYPRTLVSSVRTITTKPLDLPAAPSGLKVVQTTKYTMALSWKDNSNNEKYFFCYYRIGKGGWTIKTTHIPNVTSFQLTELKSNTQYEIRVQGVSEDGKGAYSNYLFARTKGSSSTPPNPTPSEVSRSIILTAQLIGEGPRPFTATFPASGILPGRLTKIEIPKVSGPTHYVYFVKPGYSTADCGVNPNATVMLKSGETSTSSQLSEIFGASQPKFPLDFVACISTPQGPQPNSVSIKISYIKTN